MLHTAPFPQDGCSFLQITEQVVELKNTQPNPKEISSLLATQRIKQVTEKLRCLITAISSFLQQVVFPLTQIMSSKFQELRTSVYHISTFITSGGFPRNRIKRNQHKENPKAHASKEHPLTEPSHSFSNSFTLFLTFRK